MAGTADAYQGIVTPGLAQTLNQDIGVTVVWGKLIFQCEGVFH